MINYTGINKYFLIGPTRFNFYHQNVFFSTFIFNFLIYKMVMVIPDLFYRAVVRFNEDDDD